MQVLYDIFIVILASTFRFSSLLSRKMNLGYTGRKHTFREIEQKVQKQDKVIWMHCASLGEFEQGRPVLEELKRRFPNYKVAVSFFSPSGYEVKKNYKEADVVFYLPFDTKANNKKLVEKLNPSVLILVKYDYWYNLITQLHNKNIPVYVVSAVFRAKQVYFGPIKWFRNKLKLITHFYVQDLNSFELLKKIQITKATHTGDTRFDRVRSFLERDNTLDFMQHFKNEDYKIIVAGSTWEKGDSLFIQFINENLPSNTKVIIAPHEINKKKNQDYLSKINVPIVFYSELKATHYYEDKLQKARVLILDTVGILNKVYSYANISYVGGGFGNAGLHNILEPAAYGIPVLFGPKHKKFNEAIELIKCGGAFSVEDYKGFKNKLIDLLENESKLNKLSLNAKKYIMDAPVSTKIIVEEIEKKI